MHYTTVKLGALYPNPFRELGAKPFGRLDPTGYVLEPARIKELEQSIRDTDLWTNVETRIVDDKVQIAYGHHRIQAAINVLGKNHEADFPTRDISDWMMIQMMASENSESWGMPVKHINLCVRQARTYLDALLDECETAEEFESALKGRLGSIGATGFGKAKKEGAGRGLIQSALGGALAHGRAVEKALLQLGDSDKQRASKVTKLDDQRAAKHAAEEDARKARKRGDAKQQAVAEKAARERAEEARKLDLAKEQDAFYDPASGEVFDRPAHAEAFRKAVIRPNVMQYLPREKLVPFAAAIKDTLGAQTISAERIGKEVSATFKKFLKRGDQAKAKIDHSFAVRKDIDRVREHLNFAANHLATTTEFMRANNVPLLRDNSAQKLHDAARNFTRRYVELCVMLGESKVDIQKRLVK